MAIRQPVYNTDFKSYEEFESICNLLNNLIIKDNSVAEQYEGYYEKGSWNFVGKEIPPGNQSSEYIHSLDNFNNLLYYIENGLIQTNKDSNYIEINPDSKNPVLTENIGGVIVYKELNKYYNLEKINTPYEKVNPYYFRIKPDFSLIGVDTYDEETVFGFNVTSTPGHIDNSEIFKRTFLDKNQIISFDNIFEKVLNYYNVVLENDALKKEEYYNSYKKMFLSFVSIEKWLSLKATEIENIEMFDRDTIEKFLNSYGLNNLVRSRLFTTKTEFLKRVLKNIILLLKYKGNREVIDIIFKIFGVHGLEIKKLVLGKSLGLKENDDDIVLEETDRDLAFYEVFINDQDHASTISNNLAIRVPYDNVVEKDKYWNVTKEELLSHDFNVVNTQYISIVDKVEVSRIIETIDFLTTLFLKHDYPILNGMKIEQSQFQFSKYSNDVSIKELLKSYHYIKRFGEDNQSYTISYSKSLNINNSKITIKNRDEIKDKFKNILGVIKEKDNRVSVIRSREIFDYYMVRLSLYDIVLSLKNEVDDYFINDDKIKEDMKSYLGNKSQVEIYLNKMYGTTNTDKDDLNNNIVHITKRLMDIMEEKIFTSTLSRNSDIYPNLLSLYNDFFIVDPETSNVTILGENNLIGEYESDEYDVLLSEIKYALRIYFAKDQYVINFTPLAQNTLQDSIPYLEFIEMVIREFKSYNTEIYESGIMPFIDNRSNNIICNDSLCYHLEREDYDNTEMLQRSNTEPLIKVLQTPDMSSLYFEDNYTIQQNEVNEQ